MSNTTHDLLTVPNALTVARCVATPYVTKHLHDDPEAWWQKTALFMASDNLDGIFARLEDTSSLLGQIGFRRSGFGKKADPVVDRFTGSMMVLAGIKNGVIPKSLGAAALGQKVLSSSYGLIATKQGYEIEVSMLGKRSEFATNVGLGMLFAAESIDDSTYKHQFRQVCQVIAIAGITGATINTGLYMRNNSTQQIEQ